MPLPPPLLFRLSTWHGASASCFDYSTVLALYFRFLHFAYKVPLTTGISFASHNNHWPRAKGPWGVVGWSRVLTDIAVFHRFLSRSAFRQLLNGFLMEISLKCYATKERGVEQGQQEREGDRRRERKSWLEWKALTISHRFELNSLLHWLKNLASSYKFGASLMRST